MKPDRQRVRTTLSFLTVFPLFLIFGFLPSQRGFAKETPNLSPSSISSPAPQPTFPRWSVFGEFVPGFNLLQKKISDETLSTSTYPLFLGEVGGRFYAIDSCATTTNSSCVQLSFHLKIGGGEISVHGGAEPVYVPSFTALLGLEEILFIGRQRLVGWSIQGNFNYYHAFLQNYPNYTGENAFGLIVGSGVVFNVTKAVRLYLRIDYFPKFDRQFLTIPVGIEYRI